MEKMTNKAKLEIFKFLRKSAESQGNKYSLTREFLHAEFISAMKTVQDPTVFMKTQK